MKIRATRAREILEICKTGLSRLENNPIGNDWLFDWAGTIALLRTIGFALENDPQLKTAQALWWSELKKTKPEPRIFWELIQLERNLILKEGDFRAGRSAMVAIQGVQVTAMAAGEAPKPPLPAPKLASSSYWYEMTSGPYQGEDPRRLIREAIEWWEHQITKIENSKDDNIE